MVRRESSPVSSAIGMKTPGGIWPRVGWAQRASTSKPVRRLDERSMTGWKCGVICPESMADSSAVSSSARSRIASSISGSKTAIEFSRFLAFCRAMSARRMITSTSAVP